MISPKIQQQQQNPTKQQQNPTKQQQQIDKKQPHHLLKQNASLPEIDDNLCRAVRTEIQEHNKIKGGLPEGEKHTILDLN